MTYTDVVKKLIGSIAPAGDSSIDVQRLYNLTDMTNLIYELTEEVVRVATAIDYKEHSVKVMGIHATAFLKNLSELITKEEA